MRLNIYTEELLPFTTNAPFLAEIVHADYVSSRTGEKMRNYGLRIYVKSHPDLHYVPPRDDDRSAVTFWVGPSLKSVKAFLEAVMACAEASTLETLDIWREKLAELQAADGVGFGPDGEEL